MCVCAWFVILLSVSVVCDSTIIYTTSVSVYLFVCVEFVSVPVYACVCVWGANKYKIQIFFITKNKCALLLLLLQHKVFPK